MTKNTQKTVKPQWLQDGLAYEAKGDVAGAESAYKAELQKHPDNYDAMCAWTDLACKARQYETAMMMANQAMKMAPERADAVVLLGVSIYMQGKVDVARSCFEQALNIDEHNAKALYYMATIAKEHDKDSKKALELAEKAYESDEGKELPELLNLLGNLYAESDRQERAYEIFKALVSQGVVNDVLFTNIADLLMKMNRQVEALTYYRKANEAKPDDVAILTKLSTALHGLNVAEEAYQVDQKLLKLQRGSTADSVANLYNIITYWIQKGSPENVRACTDEIIKIAPDFVNSYASYVVSQKITEDDMDYVHKMEELIKRPEKKKSEIKMLGYALGKAYSDLKQYDKAFDYYAIGARNHEGEWRNQEKEFSSFLDWLHTHLNKKFFNDRKDFGLKGKKPIFIVGTPRSGTTLTEQIISSHSEVDAGGELLFLKESLAEIGTAFDKSGKQTTERLGYPDSILHYSKDQVNAAAERYLENIKNSIGAEGIVTDKMPANYNYLPMISLMFPDAVIIHTVRHPLDACLSMFFQNFAMEHHYSYSFEGLILMYKTYYELMKVWDKILPNNIHTVCYEQLVADPETQIKALIDHCGLPWEEQCMSFYKNKRTVATASHAQVKQPLYKSSMAKWKKYEKHVEPLIVGLKDVVEDYEKRWQ